MEHGCCISTVNAWAICSVGSLYRAQGECPSAAECNRNLTGQGEGSNAVYSQKGPPILSSPL